jgi:hypothetical protein
MDGELAKIARRYYGDERVVGTTGNVCSRCGGKFVI